MKQVMREHCHSCGQVFAFLATHAKLSGSKVYYRDDDPEYCLLLMDCPPSCPGRQHKAELLHPCYTQCELKGLFLEGWQKGERQARQAFETGELTLFEEVGRAAGFTSRRPPRHYRGYTPERDGIDGNIHGDALRRFIFGWKQACAAERRNRGV